MVFRAIVCGVAIASTAASGLAQEATAAIDAPNLGDATVRSRVEPPELLHFEQATYPEQAQTAQREGNVLLKLHVDATGHVVDATVVEPAGFGFDEAAVTASRQFVFNPASKDGKNIAAKILYRYRFVLTPMKSEGGHHQALPQKMGELKGVFLAGDPKVAVPAARLSLQKPDGSVLVVTTDANGLFLCDNLPPGKYVVLADVSGFAPVREEEEVIAGKATVLKYTLIPKNENAIEVTVRGTALHREVSHYELTRDELVRVPGTMGDAIHAVESMPSVARAPAFSGMLIVRGAAPQDSQVFVEGTLLPRVFHYASLSSVVPSEMIESLEFYPSNFSVRYGRGMGGVIEVGLRETNPDRRYHGSAQMDFINARANVEGPVPHLKGWSFMAGLRGTYVDRWLVPVLRSSGSAVEGMPRYADYQFYLERKLPRQGVLRLGYLGATDKYVPIERNPREWTAPTDAFGHFQALLRLPVSSGVRLKANWSMGNIRGTDFRENDAKTRTLVFLGIGRAELSARTGGIGTARLGTDLLYAPYEIRADTTENRPGVLSGNLTDDPLFRRTTVRDVFFRPAIYGEYEYVPTRRGSIVAGLRADYSRDTREATYSPRLSFRHALMSSSRSPTLKGGVGLFYQPPAAGSLHSELGGTSTLKSQRATHFMMGVEQPLGERTTLSVEIFEKELRRLISSQMDASGNLSEANSAEGRAYGADLLLRFQPGGRFFGWIAYTLSRSTRRPEPNEPSRLYIYDQTHILNLLASYKLGRGWEVGGRFRYMSGFLYDHVSGGIFDNASGSYYPYGDISRKRMAPFHQLDIRVEKTFLERSFRWSLYADILNSYYHTSPDYMTYKYDLSQTKPLSLSFPLLPSFGVRGEL